MERRDNFLRTPAAAAGDAAANLTSSSGSSSSLTLSPPDFLRQVHAAFKRQRSLGSMQSNLPRATRVLVPRGEGPKKAGASPSTAQNPQEKVMKQQRGALGASRLQSAAPDQKRAVATVGVLTSSQDESLLTTPSILGTITDARDQNVGQNYQQKSEIDLLVDRKKSSLEVSSSQMTSRNALVGEGFKKDQFYSVGDAQLTSESDNVGATVDSRMDSMLSYLHSVSLTAGDNFPAAQVVHDQGRNHQELEIAGAAVEMDIKYDAANLSQRGIEEAYTQNHGEPMTHCSAIGSSVTAVSLHSGPTVQSTQAPHISQYASPLQMPECAVEPSAVVPGHGPPKQHKAAMSVGDWNSNNQQVPNLVIGAMDKAVSANGGCLPSQGLSANDQSTSARDDGASRPNKVEKERRKKNYDPDVFFKVNGKLFIRNLVKLDLEAAVKFTKLYQRNVQYMP